MLLRPSFLALFLALSLPSLEAAASTGGDREPSLSGTYLAGRSASRLRDISEAAQYLGDALRLDPSNPLLIERLFQLELSSGDMATSEELAKRVIEFNSQQRMARVVLGLKDFRAGHYKDARTNFTEAAYTPVGELTATLLIAWTYAGENNQPAAMKELAKLEGNESFANFRAFHEALIEDFFKAGARAEAAYKKTFEQSSGSLRITQAYGNFLLREGKKADAEKVYRTFLAGNEANVLIKQALLDAASAAKPSPFVPTPAAGAGEALFSIAAAMNDEESIDVALPYARLALEFNVDKPVMLTLLGDIYTDMQRFEAAIESYDQTPPGSALRSSADIEIALSLQKLSKRDEAQAKLKALLEREPKNLEAWTTLGNILRNNEMYGPASEAYAKAIALLTEPRKQDWQLYYFRGITLERLKQWDAAEVDLRKSLALSPDEASILNYLGYSLIDRRQKLDEAIKMVQRAVELRPNDGYIVDSLGWAYYQLGNYEEAVKHMERAVDLRSGDPIIAEHMGDVYWRLDRKLEARFQWQHAKDNKPEPEDLKRIEEKLKNGLVDPPPVKPAESAIEKPKNG